LYHSTKHKMESSIEGVFDTQMITIITLIMIIAIIFYIYYVFNYRYNNATIEVNKASQKIDLIMDYLQKKEEMAKKVTEENLHTQTVMIDEKVKTPESSVYNYITRVKMSDPDDRQSAYDDVQTVEPENVEFISNTTVPDIKEE